MCLLLKEEHASGVQLQDTRQGIASNYLRTERIGRQALISGEVYSDYQSQEPRVLYKTTDAERETGSIVASPRQVQHGDPLQARQAEHSGGRVILTGAGHAYRR